MDMMIMPFRQVVLDLDETLCSARAQHAVPAHLLRWGACNFTLTYDLGDGKGHEEVVIFPRPGVRAFLQELSSLAEIIVFTAALPGAAPRHPFASKPACSKAARC